MAVVRKRRQRAWRPEHRKRSSPDPATPRAAEFLPRRQRPANRTPPALVLACWAGGTGANRLAMVTAFWILSGHQSAFRELAAQQLEHLLHRRSEGSALASPVNIRPTSG